MAWSTVSQIGKVFFSSSWAGESVVVVWHASEPLVLTRGFYREAFRRLEEENMQGVQIRHSFQTNGTLITQEWCEFFKEREIQIGVSLDGPEWIHDAQRVDWAGRGTFSRVMRGVELLKQNGIAFSVIAVITKKSLREAEAIWQFFHKLRPERLCLNPEEGEGIHSVSSLEGEEAILHYKTFLRDLLFLNEQADEPLKIREFENVLKAVQADSPFSRSQTNVAGAILSFDCEGNISTFSPELLTLEDANLGNFHFGNVFSSTLNDMFTTTKFLLIDGKIRRGIHTCLQSCKYFLFCGGGFPSNKMSENKSFESTETQACRLRIQATADVLLDYWEETDEVKASSTV